MNLELLAGLDGGDGARGSMTWLETVGLLGREGATACAVTHTA